MVLAPKTTQCPINGRLPQPEKIKHVHGEKGPELACPPGNIVVVPELSSNQVMFPSAGLCVFPKRAAAEGHPFLFLLLIAALLIRRAGWDWMHCTATAPALSSHHNGCIRTAMFPPVRPPAPGLLITASPRLL